MTRPALNHLLVAVLIPAALAACATADRSETDAMVSASASASASGPSGTDAVAALDRAIAGSWRNPNNVLRDQYRNPRQTLTFFDVSPRQTVIEITPGGGWYAEILAPYLRGQGSYVAAVVDSGAYEAGRQRDYYAKGKADLEANFAAAPAQFDRATVVAYDPKAPRFGAPGSADVVLTFRNVHNWRAAGQAEGMFRGFFEVLKPGGTLGVVEHRATRDVPADDKSGYVGEAQVIAMAEAAGFRLDGRSEVNANPRDTRDHPNGVWMLPPAKRHDAEDAQKYLAIGESDRMTLRFVKP